MKRNESGRKIEWILLQFSEKIISRGNREWWQAKLPDSGEYILKGKIIQSLQAGNFEHVPEVSGYEQELVSKMHYEVLAMLAVFDMFLEKLVIAEAKNDTLFLNTAAKAFYVQECEQFFVDLYKGRGRKISEQVISNRIKKVHKYLTTNKTLEELQMEKTGTFYQRDIPAYLCNMAYKSFVYLGGHLGHRPEFDAEKQMAIEQITNLMKKYLIELYELPDPFNGMIPHNPIRDLFFRELPAPEQIDKYITQLKALKKAIVKDLKKTARK